MKNLNRAAGFTVFLLSINLLLLATSCLGQSREEPLTPGDVKDLGELIREAQYDHVRESYGEMAHQCFTDRDYERFQDRRVPEKIVTKLEGDRKFMEGILALQELSADDQKKLLKELRKPLRKTWAQRGEISREGQTNAGQQAEWDIANAIVDRIVELSEFSVEELTRLFREQE